MPVEVINLVARFGYFAIFLLVFLQESGFPNPVPNELILIFTGYLSFNGVLYLPYSIITVITADFTATVIIYFFFYSAGKYILQKKTKLFRTSRSIISNLQTKISEKGKISMFLFRLTPFTRGYTTVIAGIFKTNPGIFLPLALASGTIWASFYIIIGYLAGPSWIKFSSKVGEFRIIKFLLLFFLALILFLILSKLKEKHSTSQDKNSQLFSQHKHNKLINPDLP